MLHLSPETEALAQRLAQAKRIGVDEAVRGALIDKARAEGVVLEAGAARGPSPAARAARIARFEEIARAVAALPVLDPRSTQDIVDDLDAL